MGLIETESGSGSGSGSLPAQLGSLSGEDDRAPVAETSGVAAAAMEMRRRDTVMEAVKRWKEASGVGSAEAEAGPVFSSQLAPQGAARYTPAAAPGTVYPMTPDADDSEAWAYTRPLISSS